MQVTFIQAPNSQLISRIPLGLLSIGSYLKYYSNHNIYIVDLASLIRSGSITKDANIYENCSKFIINHYPAEVYAFSTVVTNEIPALQIAEKLKRVNLNAKFVLATSGHHLMIKIY